MLNRRLWTTLFSLLLIFSLAVAGCTPAPGTDTAGAHTPKQPGSIKYPIQLKDQGGNLVTIEKQPQRIVSLIPSNTEIAYALNLGKQMVGVTTNDDYPAEVKKLPKVGDFKINVEKVVALKPDLVLANAANGKETIDQLKKLGIPVLVLDAQSIRDVYKSIDLVGDATNRTREADQLVARMEKEKRDVFTKLAAIPQEKRLKVWIEISPDLFSAGGDTFMHELVTVAGGKNVAADLKGWPQVSAEQVVKWNPDVIISTHGGEQEILARKGWATISAVKNKRVYAMDPNLTNRPGPRITEGIEKIAVALYPEQFGEKK
ncbi:ABC transporter substrate-binding protein [Paenactinomyces guangxiensis]|uniref:ABC transporter substrate-binding protein n=1 Tax=Paenactinomyces guangxiensis TaxID=1490290 RepID=A0A7W1WS20_9BACL|nr:ABC transporter substrate-binding protein [Paenactinomyces guangxiensis]MBA4494816.1 ABC transporter substrate-binding protein [Paenactinomyces guangxiensis]MBH8591899.1 ABC transporter substrate-binding protein [Paenactinomyces guangxiensis]